MNQNDLEEMLNAISAQLASEGKQMEGLSFEDLREAASHPLAAAEIQKAMECEATSVQPGDPAPDFSLPYLPGSGNEGTVRLSERYAKLPVALIFGSYT